MADKIFTLSVSEQEANLILLALSKLPFDAVNALIPRLQQEAQSQLAPAAPVTP